MHKKIVPFVLVNALLLVSCHKGKDDKALLWGAALLSQQPTATLTSTGTGTGTGAGTGTGTGTAGVAPTAVTYTGSPFTYTVGVAITTLTPTLAPSGVTLTGCTVSPALPAGLSLATTTCAISGTPTATQTATNHTVIAANATGSITSTISITVNPVSPTSLTYTGSPFTFTRGTAITNLTPTFAPSGVNITSCTANPALPAGLSLDTTTCAISGTPTASQTATNHTITASNAGGNATATISVTVESIWYQEAYLKAPNAGLGDLFGGSVWVSGDTIAVGARIESSNQTTITNGTTASADNSAANSGAVYVFKRTGTTWAQEAYLKASNAEAADRFGSSLSVSGDTIAVSATQESSNQTTITNGTSASTDNSATNAGAVYVFKRTGTTWAQEAYLKASNAEADEYFGSSVSVSGDTVVVGVNGEDSNQTTITNGTTASADNSAANSGAVYVFKRTGTTWAQEAYLKAPNAEGNDNFGYSVAIDSDTIVVGATQESSSQNTITNGTTASANNASIGSGAAYVFKRTGTTWAQEAYLKAPNVGVTDQFGFSVSISADTIAVGANQERSNQTTITNGSTASSNRTSRESGAVYVFKRTGSNWESEAYLKAPNAQADDQFGYSVSVAANTIVAGARGEDSNQTTITNGTTASEDNSLGGSGATYVFKRNGTTWSQEAYLKAPNAGGGDQFGGSVSVSSDTIVVGAIVEDSNQTTITNGTTASADNSASDSGAVYVFRKQ